MALSAAACGTQRVAAIKRPPPPTVPVTTTTTTVAGPPPLTTIATLPASMPGYPEPGAASNRTVPGTWYGYRSVLPVIAEQPGWAEVRLAQRPNQATTWIQTASVAMAQTPYRLVLDLSSEHLSLYDANQLVVDVPAGVGTTSDPTVTGHYFVAMKVPPPDPGYGPFVLATSAHSDSITDWGGSGDAIIAIHGPIDSYDDSLIGTTGARISHGCIRLHDADLARLGAVPAGTPLDIIAGPASPAPPAPTARHTLTGQARQWARSVWSLLSRRQPK
jgi:hypothetical protein